MAILPEILYNKYLKAKEAVNAYTLDSVGKLSFGIKSKSTIKKIHILNMWIDYLNDFIKLPINIPAKSPTDVILSDITILDNYTTVTGFMVMEDTILLYIRDVNMNYIPLCRLKSDPSIITIDNITSRLVTSINSGVPGYKSAGIQATALLDGSIKLSFPKGATYNNGVIKANPSSISYIMSSDIISGGVDEVKKNLSYTEEQINNFTRLLDLISIELDVVYKNSAGQINFIEDTSLLSPSIPEINSLNITGGESLSTEDGSLLEL